MTASANREKPKQNRRDAQHEHLPSLSCRSGENAAAGMDDVVSAVKTRTNHAPVQRCRLLWWDAGKNPLSDPRWEILGVTTGASGPFAARSA